MRRLLLSAILCVESICLGLQAFWVLVGAPEAGAARAPLFLMLHAGSAFFAMAAAAVARGESLWAAAMDGLVVFAVPPVGAFAAGTALLLQALGRGRRGALPSRKDVAVEWKPAASIERGLRAVPAADLLKCRDLERIEDAFIRLGRGQTAAGIELVKKALDHPLGDVRSRARIMLIRLQDQAVAALVKAREEATADPDAPGPRKAAALACVLLSQLDREPVTASRFRMQALAWLSHANRLDPRDADILFRLGEVTLATDDPQMARTYFRQFLAQRPGDARALARCAECSYRLGDWAALSADCDALLKAAPQGSTEREAAEYFRRQLRGGQR